MPPLPTEFIAGLQRTLTFVGADYEAVIDSFGQVEAANLRASGRPFPLSEHVCGLVFALLSNQRPWKPIADNRAKLTELFLNFDPDALEAADPSYLVGGLRALRCGNRADTKQMESLAANIRVLRRIDEEKGLDAYVARHNADFIAKQLSQPGPYKLQQVGLALALEYLKNVGIRASKPDLHVRRALSAERLGFAPDHPTESEAYKIVDGIAAAAGQSPIYVDNLLWLFCAKGYGEVCGASPRCSVCALAPSCNYPSHRGATL